MAMYSAYFDESGHPDDSNHLIVAGGLASVEQWVHFEREWREVLAPFGTSIFHAVDFEYRTPPFDKITKQQAQAVLERLAGIICRRMERIVSFTVRMDHYRIMNSKYVFAECYGYPYPVAARSCIAGVEVWARKHSIPMEKMLFFFEDGAKHKGQLEWIAERDRLSIPVFRKKSELVPLQVGDFIAWHGTQCVNSKTLSKATEAVMRRLEGMSHSWRELDMADPDRLPAILEIPLRLPGFHYKSRVLQKHGVRRAVVHYWRRDQPKDQKVDRKTLNLPDRKTMTPDELDRAIREYGRRKQNAVKPQSPD